MSKSITFAQTPDIDQFICKIKACRACRLGGTYLLNKGLIQVVRPTDAEVDHIHASGHCIIEGIQEPGCV